MLTGIGVSWRSDLNGAAGLFWRLGALDPKIHGQGQQGATVRGNTAAGRWIRRRGTDAEAIR